ncbi:hypothetical protein [Paludisphaera soli]|uniref:hypothetical protein n=1 Tax=Paludisphaera soli TaxID=2712865 RepID=UPI0013ECE03B|nr:hypothetical protein [Paludisphaera soli]
MSNHEFDANGVCNAEFAELEAALDAVADDPVCRLCGGPADFMGICVPDRVAGERAFPFAICPDCREVPGWGRALQDSFKDDSEGVSLKRTAAATLAGV